MVKPSDRPKPGMTRNGAACGLGRETAGMRSSYYVFFYQERDNLT